MSSLLSSENEDLKSRHTLYSSPSMSRARSSFKASSPGEDIFSGVTGARVIVPLDKMRRVAANQRHHEPPTPKHPYYDPSQIRSPVCFDCCSLPR
mmetsp:Transcript_35075/g.83786  ORF Transcript_35075/g.83786 Transcript_35075/m.83786 type:complete len:95 (-) Transcript_35075:168-452(-)